MKRSLQELGGGLDRLTSLETMVDSRPDQLTGSAGNAGDGRTGAAGTTRQRLRVAVDNPPAVDASRKYQHLSQQQAILLRLVAEFADQSDLDAALMALAEELHGRFRCTRVAVAVFDTASDNLEVVALSQQAGFDPRSHGVQLLRDAMLEACDQDAVIHYPGSRPRPGRSVDAHRALAAGSTDAELCTVPLAHDGRKVGALLLERSARQLWSSLTLSLFRQIGALLAPLIAQRRLGERSLGQRLRDGVRTMAAGLLGPRHVLAKAICVLALSLLAAAQLLVVTHRVSGPGELVSAERRVITAPIQGYIDRVKVRPGDAVTAGEVLVHLDTRDLELERSKWDNEVRTLETDFRSAMADRDRKEMAVTQARQTQARAQLELVTKQIDRATITAPVNGLVVSGDLSQAVGAPVESGEVLLELAAGEDYHIRLQVDERDIRYVKPGQRGVFTPTASPGQRLRLIVRSIHPIAHAEDGANRFRVDARLESGLEGIRPGQTGVGKVDVGEASLLWLWTRDFVDWLRLKLWAVTP